MQIDVASLLAPFSDGAPCGEDIEYDPAFVELTTLAAGKPEQQVGDKKIAAEEPDYADLARRAEDLLRRSKDLRVAVILATAVLRTEGPVPFAQVLGYIRGCLETFWDHVHPLLDAEDDDDPTMRVNAVVGLSVSEKTEGPVMRALRLAPLTQSRIGRFTLRDILVAQGEIPAPPGMDAVPEPTLIAAAFQDTDAGRRSELRRAVGEARQHIRGIDEVFNARVGPEGPDLSALDRLLYRLGQVLDQYAGAEPEAEATGAAAAAGEAPPGGDAGAAAAAPARAAGGSGAINGPQDVVRMIDRICEYYERNEPSSPVPLLLKRARRLVNADFVTIIRDMASKGFDQVKAISGVGSADDDE